MRFCRSFLFSVAPAERAARRNPRRNQTGRCTEQGAHRRGGEIFLITIIPCRPPHAPDTRPAAAEFWRNRTKTGTWLGQNGGNGDKKRFGGQGEKATPITAGPLDNRKENGRVTGFVPRRRPAGPGRRTNPGGRVTVYLVMYVTRSIDRVPLSCRRQFSARPTSCPGVS